MSEATALDYHARLLHEVVLMLVAGVIHGDLSEYNILVDAEGPVIIDLPQAVDAAGNSNAGVMFERDVDNLRTYFGQFAPTLLTTHFGKEIWALYQAGLLAPDTPLTGYFKQDERKADVGAVLREIEDARLEAEAQERYRNELAS
jgi:RIO kinase 1